MQVSAIIVRYLLKTDVTTGKLISILEEASDENQHLRRTR